ncbi:hypothetical protein H1D32_23565 [Anaerobacillus sp. CMMVII]|uniref:hypothetical protein n=1 Tax=Anaerobacillus sp. CMMVII TaxID=2755588 RepID=UPI0021B7C9A3|nr:hypothetical protein [Anaerobacillus sp. CMMVII]MCT8140411.1 hypothetical protein [Anaerobacillus sp. CMMVII]
MEDNKQEGQGRNFFDSLMFGPPPQGSKTIEQQKSTSTDAPEEQTQIQQNQVQKNNGQLSHTENSHDQPQLDLVQMMQQFDSLMDYANKLGPTLKKLSPLFDLFKGFNEKK